MCVIRHSVKWCGALETCVLCGDVMLIVMSAVLFISVIRDESL